jgi:hypothetical protein
MSQKSLRHSKTIYVFTSRPVIVTLQIHSRTNIIKGLKLTTAKWTINTREQQDLCCPAARFNEKGCFLLWGGDALRNAKFGLRDPDFV